MLGVLIVTILLNLYSKTMGSNSIAGNIALTLVGIVYTAYLLIVITKGVMLFYQKESYSGLVKLFRKWSWKMCEKELRTTMHSPVNFTDPRSRAAIIQYFNKKKNVYYTMYMRYGYDRTKVLLMEDYCNIYNYAKGQSSVYTARQILDRFVN